MIETTTNETTAALVREPDLWTCDDECERLQYEDEDEAIEAHLDSFFHSKIGTKLTSDEVLMKLPETVEVYGYVRGELPGETQRKSWAAGLVEQLLEWIDDEYGDPDGGNDNENEPTCLDIAREMVDAALENYTVWRCEQITSKVINAREWVLRVRPDWLADYVVVPAPGPLGLTA